MDDEKKRQFGFSIGFVILAIIVMWLFQSLIFRPLIVQQKEVPYSEFRKQLDRGNVTEVTLTQERVFYMCEEPASGDPMGQGYNAIRVEDDNLIQDLLKADVIFRAELPSGNLLINILGWIIPFLPLAAIWYFAYRRMQQGDTGGVMSIGKSRAREIAGELTGVDFDDVGGAEEVETELREIIDFLKNPDRFLRIGAKLPKGILLVGPPGTGKTLLARATAGEAGVPFFSISGSDFVEMFVGVGAARVRDLFQQAKSKAPCIVFIDEIDAIGQSRSSAASIGSNDEREQTLNQLLNEMDGFEPNTGVVIMAATNRPDILDRALLRAGRFDRQIQVPLPTEIGRLEILKIHTKPVELAEEVNLERLAKITSGFSGADLANIVNEAALLAVRRDSSQVAMRDCDLAIERVVAGLQRNMPMAESVRRRVAYHEGGHALVAALQEYTDPVHKVSIIPTSKGALGYTMQMREEEQQLMGQEELEQNLAVMLGGRAAELLVIGEPSSGAANDLQRATDIALRMVTEFGMTEEMGPVRYAAESGTNYLGVRARLRPELGPDTAASIDREVRRLVETAQEKATTLLQENEQALHDTAQHLLEEEVISGDEIEKIVEKHNSVGSAQNGR